VPADLGEKQTSQSPHSQLQDGCVRVWDPRQRALVTSLELHVNEKGKGAAGDLCAGG